MHDLEGVFQAAWAKVRELMERDPDELRARLARRRRVRFSQPVREWCITVRANDRRIGGRGAAVVPGHAVAVVRAHEVRLEKRGLMWLCRPIEAGFPYTELREFAVEAGTTAGEVHKLVRRGRLGLVRYQGLGGKWCPWGGIPGVQGDELVNPGAKGFATPDSIWGYWWKALPEWLGDDFVQSVAREPVWHADKNGSSWVGRRGRSGLRKLDTGARFWGWKWRCPGCARLVSQILLPVPVLTPKLIRRFLARHAKDEPKEIGSGFACARCHNVKGRLSWADGTKAWNEIILRASGGLMYGREVEVPPHIRAKLGRRVRAGRRARPSGYPAPKREAVLDRLLLGWTYGPIGKDLGMSTKCVYGVVLRARRAYGVRTRGELIDRVREERGRGAKVAG